MNQPFNLLHIVSLLSPLLDTETAGASHFRSPNGDGGCGGLSFRTDVCASWHATTRDLVPWKTAANPRRQFGI